MTPGIGWGADLAYTGTIILSSSYPANTDAYALGLSYAFTPTTTVAASYTITDDDDLSYGKASYVSLTGNYAFEGALKGLNLLVMYDKENRDKAGLLDKHEFRFSASYKF